MIDKKTESDIKAVKGYLEFWSKFHYIYKSVISKDAISSDDEVRFLEAKENIRAKYGELRKGLDVNYMPHSRLTDPVNDILSLSSMRFVSEKSLRKMEEDWRDSYIFLNSVLERLTNKKKRLEQFNPIGVYLKRIFDRRA